MSIRLPEICVKRRSPQFTGALFRGVEACGRQGLQPSALQEAPLGAFLLPEDFLSGAGLLVLSFSHIHWARLSLSPPKQFLRLAHLGASNVGATRELLSPSTVINSVCLPLPGPWPVQALLGKATPDQAAVRAWVDADGDIEPLFHQIDRAVLGHHLQCVPG